METIAVRPLVGFGKTLGYRLPPQLNGQVRVGSLVRIPLQRRAELGIVEDLEAPGDFPADRLKFIHELAQPFPVLTPDLIRLAHWMSQYYACGLDAVFEAMIPAPVRKGMRPKRVRFLSLARRLEADELAALEKKAARQADLYKFVAAQAINLSVPREPVLKRLKMTGSVADGLVEKGILRETQGSERRDAYTDEFALGEQVQGSLPTALTTEQTAAVEALSAALAEDSFTCHLLEGVTGSGKTEVYLTLLREVLEQGGGALFLVPEVALAPQTVGRLRARMEAQSGGAGVVVWHSHLSEGERYDAWHALAEGEARVVVGARSAVFAPVNNLRLIVVDEEHEPAFKQEEVPRYHGRDVAVYRAHLAKALCILGSATPSLETVHNARLGKYRHLRLTKRVEDRPLPLLHILDMKREIASARAPVVFARLLIDKIRDRLEAKEQSILFINRRGYDASLRCPDCGYIAMCDHCDISMTHHRVDNILRCHLCGHEEYVPPVCPKCRSPKIHYKGAGTQKVEDVAQKLFPQAKVVRLDADAMRKKNLFRSVLDDFRRGRIDILVGTQIIAKGLDFPNVTLVGLIDADLSLHLPDFRAAERTFQLLVQVSGRAGRGDMAGEVVVQTYMPYADVFQFAKRQEFTEFAEAELQQRAEFGYPPYRHLLHHIFRSKNREKLVFYTDQWAKAVEKEVSPHMDFEMRGPVPCPIERIKDHFRFQLWYLTPKPTALVPRLQALRQTFPWDKEITEVLDVDAMNLI